MEESGWQVIEEVSGSGLAEIIRGLLEAQEITVLLSQEGAGHFGYPVNVGRLSVVQILVPEKDVARAKSILDEYHAGELSEMQLEKGDDSSLEDEDQGNDD